MATGVNKKALYIYRLTFGNTINKKDNKLSTLLLEQGVRKEFTEGNAARTAAFEAFAQKYCQP